MTYKLLFTVQIVRQNNPKVFRRNLSALVRMRVVFIRNYYAGILLVAFLLLVMGFISYVGYFSHITIQSVPGKLENVLTYSSKEALESQNKEPEAAMPPQLTTTVMPTVSPSRATSAAAPLELAEVAEIDPQDGSLLPGKAEGPQAEPQGDVLADYVWKQCQQLLPDYQASLSDYSHIRVDDEHKMLYCPVPKVACTNWGRVMMVLRGRIDPKDMLKANPYKKDNENVHPSLCDFSASEAQYRLKNYFKFTTVRHPLERLLSAFRSKLLNPSSPNVRRKFVPRMRPEYRNVKVDPVTKKSPVDDVVVRFDEFLQMIADGGEHVGNPHWSHYYKRCHPCSVHFDYIAQIETLNADLQYILKAVNASVDISFPDRSSTYRKEASSNFVDAYYQKVPDVLMRRVIRVYETDIRMFNFSVSDYLSVN